MTFDAWIIVGLAVTNVFQMIYWSRETHKLLDKLMSRNYAEYEQVKNLRRELPHALTMTEEDQDLQDEDLKSLNNTMAGLI